MPATEPPFDLLAQRADLLRAVRDGAPPKPELAAALSVSRSTVDRAVRDLEDSGLVERAGGVTLTLKGRLALDSYETFAAHLRDFEAAETALKTLPNDARVDRSLFRDATVVEATPVAPQRATEAYRSLVADATRVRGYASALLDGNVQTFR